MTVAQSDDVRALVVTLFLSVLVYIAHRNARREARRGNPVETIGWRYVEVLCACGAVLGAAQLVVSLLNINVLNAVVLVAGASLVIFIVMSSSRWFVRRRRLPRDR